MTTCTKKSLRNTALTLAAIPAMLWLNPLQAAEFNYDYIEIGGSQVDLEFGDLDIDKTELTGFIVQGSYSYSDTIVVGGGYGVGKGDSTGGITGPQGNFRDSVDFEASVASVFVLYHAALNGKADYQVGADFSRIDREGTSPSIGRIEQLTGDDDSKGLFAGARYQYNDKIELDVSASYDLDADEDEFEYDFGARYELDSTLALGFNIDPSNDETAVTLLLRKYLF